VIAIFLVGAILLRTSRPPDLPPPTLGGNDALVTLAAPPTKEQKFAESMTQGPLIFDDTFGPDRGELIWPLTLNDPKQYQNIEANKGYHIWQKMLGTALPILFDEEHVYGSGFQYEMEFTISEESQGDSATGIIFRFRPDDKGGDQYYVF